MKNKFTLACLVALLAMSGCSFEEAYLGVSCPGSTAVELNASLDYVLLADGTVCKAENCASIESCCRLNGKDAKMVFEAFEHGKCPADSLFSTCHQDLKGLWFCGGEQEVCRPGYHIKGEECVMDTLTACGAEGVTCNTENTHTVECAWDDKTLSAKCIIHECKANFHLKDELCVADTETACGVKEIDCTKIEGTSCSYGECIGNCNKSENWCIDTCYNFVSLHIQSCSSDGMVCAPRFADWDEDKSNGCEIDLDAIHVQDFTITTEPKTSESDPEEPGTEPEMVKVIHVTCVSGYANWDSDVYNGCETILADVHVATWNPENDKIQCMNGFGDCDGIHAAATTEENGDGVLVEIAANGCEADFNLPEYCGACDGQCDSSQVCINQKCELNTCSVEKPDMCLNSESQRICVNTHSTDANNCGLCGYVCANHPTATATSAECLNGVCQYICKPEYTQCSVGVTADSISCVLTSSMQTDNNNCGGCGDIDTGEHICASDESCVAGQCVKNTCGGSQTLCGLGDCRTTNSDDVNNCGACGYVCSEHPIDVALSDSCLNGVCQYTCPAETHKNCGGSDASSLKCVSIASMNYDNYNCGDCGNTSTGEHICNSDESCIDGSCQANTCLEGQTLCGINGGINDCRTTNGDDSANCGFCNYKCIDHPVGVATSEVCLEGTCQYSCPSTHQNCGGTTADSVMCVSTDLMQYDNYHCGNCDTVCASDESCVAGECKKNSCSDGQTLCGLDDCRDTKSDTSNCGACNNACADNAPVNTQVEGCTNGVCQYSCPSTHTNCGGTTASTIMCVSTDSMQYDNYHCGSCTKACNSDESCVDGNCVKNTCGEGLTLCGLDDCRDTKSDTSNCGACNIACADSAPVNTQVVGCTNGVCQYSCPSTHTNCGGTTANSIMCVSTDSMQHDNYHCGNCTTVCGSDESCVAGVCKKNTCSDGLTFCGLDDCRDTKTDTNNCGSCNNSCSANAPLNSQVESCSNGVCQYLCPSTHQNCGTGTTANSIMCVLTDSMQYDNYHCGNCDTACASDESCVAGHCVKNTCNDGKTLCGLNDCRDTTSSIDNCGACSNNCSTGAPVNATATSCVSGVCQYSCPSTHQNCGEGTTANTIMCVSTASMQYDNYHCGNCTTVCGTDESCVAGTCLKNTCASGQTLCALGDCRDTNSDTNNCGACNNICPSGLVCNSGKCECSNSSLTYCGSTNPFFACIDLTNNTTNCGSCNRDCNAIKPAHTTVNMYGGCVNGECQFNCETSMFGGASYFNKGTGNTASTIYCVLMGTPTCCGTTCVDCTAQNTSTDFYVCKNNACVKSNCANGQLTCDNKCIDMDDNNCGFCGHACDSSANEHCIDGVCTAE